MLTIYPGDQLNPLPFVVVGGCKRYLACLPPHANFGALPKFGDSVPLVPRSEWVTINRRPLFPPNAWVLDQNGYSSCVGNGSAAALRKARMLAGQTDVELSPGALYAQINGGRDQGAVISDALTALQQTGTCSYATVGQSPFYLNQLPAGWQQEANRFRISQAYHCQTFDEIGSALQLGYIVVYGTMVGRNFQNFDQYGVAGHTAGPGNHCEHGDGMTQLPDGRWVIDNCNSWGATWGPWSNGRCYFDEAHFGNGDQPDAFAILAAMDDPQDPHAPPVGQ